MRSVRCGPATGAALLRQTWLAYLDAGGSQTETAAALGIHRNTLTYRLRQIAQLTGHAPDDPRMRLAVHVALAAERMPDTETSRRAVRARRGSVA